MKIGFIGLGTMGKPMARNLMKAGHEVMVFNRSTPAIDQLVSEGCDDGHRRLDERPVAESQRDVQQRKGKETLKWRREEIRDPFEVRRSEDDEISHILGNCLEEEWILCLQRVRHGAVHGENTLDIGTVKLGWQEVNQLSMTRRNETNSKEDVEGLFLREELQKTIDDVVHPLNIAHLLVVQVDRDLWED